MTSGSSGSFRTDATRLAARARQPRWREHDQIDVLAGEALPQIAPAARAPHDQDAALLEQTLQTVLEPWRLDVEKCPQDHGWIVRSAGRLGSRRRGSGVGEAGSRLGRGPERGLTGIITSEKIGCQDAFPDLPRGAGRGMDETTGMGLALQGGVGRVRDLGPVPGLGTGRFRWEGTGGRWETPERRVVGTPDGEYFPWRASSLR